jgi:hypothetical protein
MIGLTREDGTVLRVVFKHAQDDSPKRQQTLQPVAFLGGRPEKKKKPTLARAITFCHLVKGKGKLSPVVATGYAVCKWIDRQVFTKDEGRRRAIMHLLENAEKDGKITTDERGIIFASYVNRPRKGNTQTETLNNG